MVLCGIYLYCSMERHSRNFKTQGKVKYVFGKVLAKVYKRYQDIVPDNDDTTGVLL